jgi:VWFA-related protein
MLAVTGIHGAPEKTRQVYTSPAMRASPGAVPRGTLVALAAVAALALLGLAMAVQAQAPAPPSFPTQAEAITVDVVVLDRDGQPVRGLTREDFTLLEDGRPQAIVGFEARHAPEPAVPAQAAPLPEERVATNAAPATPGRTFVVLLDDQGTGPMVMEQVKASLGTWLRTRAAPGDEVTVLSVSGDVWWSDRAGPGREDLLAVLGRVKGKRLNTANTETMSEQEAYQISTYEGRSEGSLLSSSRGEPAQAQGGGAAPSRLAMTPHVTDSASVVDRVARRWLDLGLCCWCSATCTYDCSPPLRKCKDRVRLTANEVQDRWTRRAQVVLGALERVSSQLAGLPGRKSILLVTEEFQRDVVLESRLRGVVDAAQRGNTAIYFTGALGLATPSARGVEAKSRPTPGDFGALAAEQALALAGGEELAEMTGGVATRSNDLAAGLERMAVDSSAYYLLGYQPERLPDGKWRKLEVKVARKDVTVRGRRGYRAAPLPPPVPARPGRPERKEPPPLVAGGDQRSLPLRLASYLQGPDGAGGARVLLALELDGDRVRVDRSEGGAKASLDLTVLAVSRDRPQVLPLGQELDLTLKESEVAGWWALFREVRLPPGVAQVRVSLRDKASGATGSVHQRVEVPDVEAPYLSTLLVSDRTQPPLQPGEPPRLVPTAHRQFAPQGPLFCQYELFSFGGRSLPGVPRVTGGYTLERPDGQVLTVTPPTPIANDGHRVVRRLAIPLDGLPPGPYRIVVTVEDHLAQKTLTARESFTVQPVQARGSGGR